MDRHASSAELKAKAKGQMLGKYGTLVPAFLVVEVIMTMIDVYKRQILNLPTCSTITSRHCRE